MENYKNSDLYRKALSDLEAVSGISIYDISHQFGKILNSNCELIRAEALDFAIECNLDILPEMLWKLFESESSDLVRGRLLLAAGKRRNLYDIEFINMGQAICNNSYEISYFLAASCLINRRMKDFINLCSYTFSEETHVSSITMDLVVLVSPVEYNSLIVKILVYAKDINHLLTDKANMYIDQLKE